jgi:hypothetical protein
MLVDTMLVGSTMLVDIMLVDTMFSIKYNNTMVEYLGFLVYRFQNHWVSMDIFDVLQ